MKGLTCAKREMTQLNDFCKTWIFNFSNVFNYNTNYCFITCQKSNYWLKVGPRTVQMSLTYSCFHRCLNHITDCCEIFNVNCKNMWWVDVMLKIRNLTAHLKYSERSGVKVEHGYVKHLPQNPTFCSRTKIIGDSVNSCQIAWTCHLGLNFLSRLF